jgi:hypothetical protein
MRPSSADHRAAQNARDARRDRGAPQSPLDPAKRPRRKAPADTRERAGAGQRRSHPASRVGDGEPRRGLQVTDARPGPRTRDYGPPTGHVVGHQVGELPPRPRDLNRPSGRIGPYDDVEVRHHVRPLLTDVVVRHDVRPLLSE